MTRCWSFAHWNEGIVMVGKPPAACVADFAVGRGALPELERQVLHAEQVSPLPSPTREPLMRMTENADITRRSCRSHLSRLCDVAPVHNSPPEFFHRRSVVAVRDGCWP